MLREEGAFSASAMPDLRVLIVSPDPLVRAGLAALLAEQPAYAVVGEESGDAGLPAAVAAAAPDVVVWDLGWDPRPELEHLGEVAGTRVPLLVLVPDEASAAQALASGARGLLPRDAGAARLLASVGAVGRGLVALDPEIAPGAWRIRERGAAPLVEDLTPREMEVLQLLAEGLSNKAIAERLRISDHTAKYHVNAILGKLEAQTRTEAVTRAARLGLILL